MEWDLLWKAAIMVIGGTILLRVAGRKSIAQMTLAQTVIMIGLGSLLIQPIAGENIWATLMVGAILVLTLIAMEYLQIKSDLVEKVITGKSITLIESGQIVEKNLRKLRLTVDQLEMQLRQANISKISDVQWATLEPNGRVGYMLKPNAQYATKEDVQQILNVINERLPIIPVASGQLPPQITNQPNTGDIFTEVVNKSHATPPPENLQ